MKKKLPLDKKLGFQVLIFDQIFPFFPQVIDGSLNVRLPLFGVVNLVKA